MSLGPLAEGPLLGSPNRRLDSSPPVVGGGVHLVQEPADDCRGRPDALLPVPERRHLDPEELGEQRLRQTEELAGRTDPVRSVITRLKLESEVPNREPLLWALAGGRELGHLAEPLEDLLRDWKLPGPLPVCRPRPLGLAPPLLRVGRLCAAHRVFL